MAYEGSQTTISLPASSALAALAETAKIYHFIIVNSSGEAAVSGEDGNAIGILQNAPDTAGQPAEVCIAGLSKLQMGAIVAAGKAVGSHSDGKGDQHDTDQIKLGILVTASSAATDVVTCLFTGANGQSGDI